eukprot:45864_1
MTSNNLKLLHIWNSRIHSNLCTISIRNYRARYQIKTKARFMPLSKWLRVQRQRGKETPESIITDIGIAKESHLNSEILSMVNSYDIIDAKPENKQNIPLISDRFFQQYFLPSFNKANTSEELRTILTNLKHKLSITKLDNNEPKSLTNLQKFEVNILRLDYHSCIGR